MREPTSKGKLRRPDTPPQTGKPRREVIRLKGGQTVECTVISPKFWAYVIHWNDSLRRSQPCYENREICDGCKDELPQKRLWYLCVWTPGYGKAFVEFTEAAANQLMELFAGQSSYRGLRFQISRTKANNGRLRVNVWDSVVDLGKLPPDEDPEEVLAKMWRAKRA